MYYVSNIGGIVSADKAICIRGVRKWFFFYRFWEVVFPQIWKVQEAVLYVVILFVTENPSSKYGVQISAKPVSQTSIWILCKLSMMQQAGRDLSQQGSLRIYSTWTSRGSLAVQKAA